MLKYLSWSFIFHLLLLPVWTPARSGFALLTPHQLLRCLLFMNLVKPAVPEWEFYWFIYSMHVWDSEQPYPNIANLRLAFRFISRQRNNLKNSFCLEQEHLVRTYDVNFASWSERGNRNYNVRDAGRGSIYIFI